jgi:superfamily II helicase
MPKELIINQQVITLLTTQLVHNICDKCQTEQEIRLIVQKKIGTSKKQYCQSCALNMLDQLAQSQHDFPNKDQIIKELRAELQSITKITEIYYACNYCPPQTQATLTQYVHSHQ